MLLSNNWLRFDIISSFYGRDQKSKLKKPRIVAIKQQLIEQAPRFQPIPNGRAVQLAIAITDKCFDRIGKYNVNTNLFKIVGMLRKACEGVLYESERQVADIRVIQKHAAITGAQIYIKDLGVQDNEKND